MLIQVSYDDNKYDYIKDFMLDRLIESGTISGFRRSTGWVRIGTDRIRTQKREDYPGVDRRAAA